MLLRQLATIMLLLQAIQIRNNLKMLDEQIKNANSKSGALKLRNLEAEARITRSRVGIYKFKTFENYLLFTIL